MSKYKIGINTDCECGETFEETLQNIKAAGFESIMLAEKSGDLETNLSLAREMGFEIPFVHLGYRHPYKNMNDMWKEGRENHEFIKDFTRRLEILHKYNIKTAVIHPYCARHCKDGEIPSTEHAIVTMREILKTASKLGIKIAVENLIAQNTVFTAILLDNINSPDLGFCYDVGHRNLYNLEKDLLAIYGDRCFAIHLHDNLMDDKTANDVLRDLHYLPFDGKIDFEKEMGNIAASGYDGVIMLEVHRHMPVGNEPHPIYKNLSVAEYLNLAKTRGEKLAQMFSTNHAEIRSKNS